VLAHFSLLVEELGAQLAQFLAAAMLELSGGYDEGGFVFHGDSPLKPNYLKQ
jgi:hypothetical protein